MVKSDKIKNIKYGTMLKILNMENMVNINYYHFFDIVNIYSLFFVLI